MDLQNSGLVCSLLPTNNLEAVELDWTTQVFVKLLFTFSSFPIAPFSHGTGIKCKYSKRQKPNLAIYQVSLKVFYAKADER